MCSAQLTHASEPIDRPSQLSDPESFFLFLAESVDDAGELITPLDLADAEEELDQDEYASAEEDSL